MTKAVFGAGCFWGVEEKFRAVPGVKDVAVGYSGGHTDNPTYEQVCSGTTGHAEVVEVEYDPGQVTFDQLMETFWQSHDPTQMNRQGPDVGTQYRSAIFYLDEEQKTAAEAAKEALQSSARMPGTIATEITAATTFWRAEEYHQQYIAKRRGLVR